VTGTAPHTVGARLRTGAAAVVLLVGTLVGCTGGAPLVPPATTAQLQAGVLSVTASAASGDYAGAQAALAGLEAALATAVDDGGLTEAQATRIRDAIRLIEADLAALTAPATSTRTPGTPAPATDAPARGPADTPAPEATTTPTPTPTTPPPTTAPPTPAQPTPTAQPTPPRSTPEPTPTPDPAPPADPDVPDDSGGGTGDGTDDSDTPAEG
jgi:outer membrane biosynthesis protein TonB